MRRTAALLLCLALIFALAACGEGSGGQLPAPEMPSANTPEPTPSPTPEPEPIVVDLTLAGDLVMHTPLNSEVLQPDGSYDYSLLFEDVEHYVSDADYALCCLEASMTGTPPWTGYPMFHVPDDLAYSLKDVGFDLINMASNHSMDGFKSGIDRTLDVLDDAGLDHVGTYRSQAERDENNGILVKDINGISIAFLDFTYGTNGIPLDGFEYAVNVYNHDYMTTLVDINYDMLAADMAAARALDTDVIAVSVHWGAEYMTTQNQYQEAVADFLFEQGADLVIGGHPHVPQPMEIREIDNGDGTTRTGFLCYCLGNLLSCQTQPNTDLTAMVQLQLTKDPKTGETTITGCDYVPMIMINLPTYGIYQSPDGWQRRLWDIRAAISDYENGDDRGGLITPYMYNSLVDALADCERIFGDPVLPGESEI